MWIHTCWLVFLVLSGYQKNVAASEDEDEFSLLDDTIKDRIHLSTDWYSLGGAPLYELFDRHNAPVCKNNITTADILFYATLQINFQPKNQFGILGISVCSDQTREDCYVVEIFGLISGRMGYFWRRHSRNETGEELWVPGKKSKLPSTLLKSDVVVRKGTWDREGRTVYQFYIEIGYDNHIRIRYNGGTAKQQKEMAIQVPWEKHNLMYSVITVASYYNDSKVEVEGSTGCSTFKRMKFEPGQDIIVSSDKPLGAIGLSLCTDSGQYECYVLEVVGIYKKKLNYFWRKHSLEESGEESWIPGLETKLPGSVIAQGENKWKFMDASAWKEAPEGFTLFIKRTSDDKLKVHLSLQSLDIFAYHDADPLIFDIPSDFQFATAGNRAIVNGKEVDRPNIATLGPCFNGDTLRFITQTCKQRIPPRDPAYPAWNKYFRVYSVRPGVAEASVVSNVLKSRATRKTLCLSLLGIASQNDGSITVTAFDASGKTNETVKVGQLAYNKIYPPEWQRKRMSVDLPPSLQNVPLRVKLTSKRPRPDSFVLVREAKLCSFDGCGLPTADGIPFIAFGQKTHPAKYPWHVAIFQKTNQTHFQYICGGSLIRADSVVSAAHCFTNDQGKLVDKGKFKLAVGKVINSLYQYEPNQQFSNALDIQIPERYSGILNNYVHDIAIVLVNFTTSSFVLPACIDWFENALPSLEADNVGQVAGWGLHEGNAESRDLFFANLPFIPYDRCVKAIPETFVEYVTTDKFCAGNINGSTVKKGDSGGGLVFQTGGLWYLRGVVSVGVPQQLTYTTFTDISHFMPWIRKVLKIES